MEPIQLDIFGDHQRLNMNENMIFDEEDKRVVVGEMLTELLAEQSSIMDRLLNLRMDLTKTQTRIEFLRNLNQRHRA